MDYFRRKRHGHEREKIANILGHQLLTLFSIGSVNHVKSTLQYFLELNSLSNHFKKHFLLPRESPDFIKPFFPQVAPQLPVKSTLFIF